MREILTMASTSHVKANILNGISVNFAHFGTHTRGYLSLDVPSPIEAPDWMDEPEPRR